MRFILLVAAILLFGFITQQILPWWTILLLTGLLGLFFDLSTAQRFSAGFLAVFLLWGGYAFYLNMMNEGMLSEKMGILFGGLSGGILLLLTALLGGIIGGLGALTGSLGYALFKRK